MRARRTVCVLGVLAALAGGAIAVAPFLTALGDSGPPEHYPGSILDLKPLYGGFLIAVGIGIAALAVTAARFRHPVLSLAAAAIAIAAGLSLDTVDVVIDNAVIYRSFSVLELRGPAPILAAVASLVSLLAALGLAFALAISQRFTIAASKPPAV